MRRATSIAEASLQAERIARGRRVLSHAANALSALADGLGPEFSQAVAAIGACRGLVVVTGVGKAGRIGEKISATLASTGTRSLFLHATEAVHGDLGRVRGEDLVLLLSYSGETAEVLRLMPSLAELGVVRIAVTARRTSTLARTAEIALPLGIEEEACRLGLAPSTSTTAMLALGDALALTVAEERGYSTAEFARVHPGGALGRRLQRVEQAMRPLAECRVAAQTLSIREVFAQAMRPGRRSGAVLLVDEAGLLRGLFTDSDLARLFEKQRVADLDRPIAERMTRQPKTIRAGESLVQAVALLGEWRISELPVVDEAGRPLGLLDITDLVDMMPGATGTEQSAERSQAAA